MIQQANQAYSDYLSSREALSTALVLREQAQEQLRLAQEQFRLGQDRPWSSPRVRLCI